MAASQRPSANSTTTTAAALGFAAAVGSSLLRHWARKRLPAHQCVLQATRVGDWFNSNGACAPSMFDGNPLAVTIAKPRCWDSLPAPATKALAFYDSHRLYLAYLTDSGTFKHPAGLTENGAEWAAEQDMPAAMRSILNDDRMEAFLWPSSADAGADDDGPYYAFEVNRGGRAIVSHTRFVRRFDFHWRTAHCKAAVAAAASVEAKSGAGAATAAAETDQVASRVSCDDGGSGSERIVFTFAVEFADLGVTAAELEAGVRTLRAGLYRACRADESGAEMAWASWIDPGDDTVDFHRPETLGRVHFLGRQ